MTADRKTDAAMAGELNRIARMLLSYGRHGAADELLKAAKALDPESPGLVRTQAFAAYRMGRYGEAAELARAARQAETKADSKQGADGTGLPGIGLSLIEAFSLVSLGRASEAGQRYAALRTTPVQASVQKPRGSDDGNT
jgi:hypothetical protein